MFYNSGTCAQVCGVQNSSGKIFFKKCSTLKMGYIRCKSLLFEGSLVAIGGPSCNVPVFCLDKVESLGVYRR